MFALESQQSFLSESEQAVNDNIIYQLSDTGAQKLEIAKDKYALTLSKKSTTAENMLHESTAQAVMYCIPPNRRLRKMWWQVYHDSIMYSAE